MPPPTGRHDYYEAAQRPNSHYKAALRSSKMDATITYDEVAALVVVNIPTLEPRPSFERTCMLRWHLERALQRLTCPQSVQHGWKGRVMARELYSLLTNIPFRLPTNPGASAIYVRDCRERNRHRLTPYSIAASTPFFRCRTSNTRVYGPRREHQRCLQGIERSKRSRMPCGDESDRYS